MNIMILLVSVGVFKVDYKEFFNLPKEVQRGFVQQFRLVIDSAINCGSYYKVFGYTMTILQFKTISKIVKRFDKCQNEKINK